MAQPFINVKDNFYIMNEISRKLPHFIVVDYYVFMVIMTTTWKTDVTKDESETEVGSSNKV